MQFHAGGTIVAKDAVEVDQRDPPNYLIGRVALINNSIFRNNRFHLRFSDVQKYFGGLAIAFMTKPSTIATAQWNSWKRPMMRRWHDPTRERTLNLMQQLQSKFLQQQQQLTCEVEPILLCQCEKQQLILKQNCRPTYISCSWNLSMRAPKDHPRFLKPAIGSVDMHHGLNASRHLQTATATSASFFGSSPCSPSWKAAFGRSIWILQGFLNFRSGLTATCRVVWDPAWVLATFTSSLGSADALDSFFGVHIHNWTNIYRWHEWTWSNKRNILMLRIDQPNSRVRNPWNSCVR